MDKISELIKGAIDMHIHSGPGLFERSVDHLQTAREAIAAGMRAIVVKDQHSMTCNAVYFIKNYILKDEPLEIYGGLVLNNATGGINPYTVDAAIKYGAKVIWMPTFSSKLHLEYKAGLNPEVLATVPSQKVETVKELPLTILDDQGRLKPEIPEICRLIAEADIILGTGHLSKEEIKLLIHEAKRQGVKRILMNHPDHIIGASIEEMKEFVKQGVVIEHTYTLVYSNKLTHGHLFEMIRGVGAEHTIVGSDLGQAGRPTPVQGLKNFIEKMLALGLKDEEIDLLLRRNPAKLLGLN